MRVHLERIERKLDNHDDDDLYGWDGPIETLEEFKEFEVQLADVLFRRKLVNIIKSIPSTQNIVYLPILECQPNDVIIMKILLCVKGRM